MRNISEVSFGDLLQGTDRETERDWCVPPGVEGRGGPGGGDNVAVIRASYGNFESRSEASVGALICKTLLLLLSPQVRELAVTGRSPYLLQWKQNATMQKYSPYK